MTYTSVDELPTEVRRAFSKEDAETWLNAYNTKFLEVESFESPNEWETPQFLAREFAWDYCKNLPSSRYVMSNVSTAVVDKDGDLADVDRYVDAGQEYVSSGGQVARNHSNKTIGVTWKVFKGIDKESGKACVIACVNFFRGKPTYDRAWADFKTRRLEWSIGSIVKSIRECDTNTCYNRLYPEQWFELSLVDFARNPITYNIEMNETAKGDADAVIEIHDEECPILKKYKAFKEHMKAHGVEAHIVDGGVMMLSGEINDEVKGHIVEEYPEHTMHQEKLESGEEICLLIPHAVDDSDDFLRDMVELVRDEQEAIAGYHTITESLAQGHYLNDEDLDKVIKAFDEVIRDEENHIGVILGVIKMVSPDLYSSIADGMEEVDEATKGCPAGQHEHAGVVGCHDIFRKHSIDYKTNPMDKLDLTDENIDVNAIKNTPTPKLREIVVRIARILTRYDKDAVKEFMSHTSGKEFVLAYLELKRRQMQDGDDGMSESNINNETAPADAVQATTEADKGLLADPQTSIATIASTLASLVPMLDGINARLLRVETAIASQNEQKTDITSAILSDASVAGQEGADPNGMPAPAAAGTEEKADPAIPESPVAESTDDAEEKTDAPFPPKDEEAPAEDKKEDDGDKKEESSDDSKSEDSESKDEAPADDKKSDEEKKPEPEKKDDEKKKDDEAKKGTEEEAPAVTEEAPVEAPKGEESAPVEPAPVVEATTEEAEKMCDKAVPSEEIVKAAEEAKPEPVAEAPAHEPAPMQVQEIEMPVPPGGNTVDFRARINAVEQRKSELKAKGINFAVADGATSLAQQPGTIQTTTTGVSLVQPSNTVSPFTGGVVQPTSSMKGLWKDMGKYDPETFFNKLKGE